MRVPALGGFYRWLQRTFEKGLDELWVVYPGIRGYALGDRIKVRPLAACIQPRKTSGRIK